MKPLRLQYIYPPIYARVDFDRLHKGVRYDLGLLITEKISTAAPKLSSTIQDSSLPTQPTSVSSILQSNTWSSITGSTSVLPISKMSTVNLRTVTTNASLSIMSTSTLPSIIDPMTTAKPKIYQPMLHNSIDRHLFYFVGSLTFLLSFGIVMILYKCVTRPRTPSTGQSMDDQRYYHQFERIPLKQNCEQLTKVRSL